MKASSTTKIDFNELTRLIAREIDSALRLSNLSKEWDEKLHISNIKIKLGRVSPPSSKIQKDDNLMEGVGGEPPNPFLLLEHYPPAKQGWEFELEFSAGEAPPKARRKNGVWQVIPPVTPPTADLLFRTMPIDVIKGVDKSWSERLARSGISKVGEFMSLEHKELLDLTKQTRSKYPLELYSKVHLLRVAVPEIPISGVDRYTLLSLIGKSARGLRKLIGPNRISATASEHLYGLLSLLNIVIDRRVLKRILLKDLRKLFETI
jgi:hypothetical protein